MGRPTAAYVDLAALKQNIQSIAAGSKAAHLMAMVKADAYGHGILPCAKAAPGGRRGLFRRSHC